MSAQEFKVGQTVSGEDYERLPVGSVVSTMHWPERIKVSEDEWRAELEGPGFKEILHSSEMDSPRTLTHLPAAKPEDKDDLYVEPEPLKEGDWYEVLARFDGEDSTGRLIFDLPYVTSDGRDATVRNIVRADAIVRPADGAGPPWLTEERPVTVTISGTRVFSEESGAPMVRLETGPGSYALIPVANISSITEDGAS